MDLVFSLDGKWITDFVRNRFLYEGMSFDWVIQTISEILKPNGLTDGRIEQIAQDIVLGRSYFKGNTRDGSFVYCDCSDEPIKSDLFRKYSTLWRDFKREEKSRIDSAEAWQELALVLKGEIGRYDCKCQCNIDLLKPTPMEDFFDRMIAQDEDVAPYGFITPDGAFIPVEWGCHEEFAGNYIRTHCSGWDVVLDNGMHTATDYLVFRRGWLLLHNPNQGKPSLTSGDKPMTKSQREALYDYYMKAGMKKEANALFEECEV